MFEFDQEQVSHLLEQDSKFSYLYQKHDELDAIVDEVNAGVLHMEQEELEITKKQRLLIRDQLTGILQNYQPDNA